MTAGLGILGGKPRRTRRAAAPGLRGLGSLSTGVVIAYQIDMRTAGASTRTDGVMDAASCSALSKLLADIRANPTSAGVDEVIHDAEIRILNGAADIQALCASGGTSAASSSSSTSTSVSSGVPTPYWPDSRVKSAQLLLNTELGKAKCSTVLKTDGLIGPGTCGALTWAVPRTGLSQDLIDLVRANAAAFQTACSKVTLTMPSCPAPVVAPSPTPTPAPAPAPDGKALMVSLQGLLNQALARFGYQAIPVSGKWDSATCGAGAAVNPLLPLGDPMRTAIGNLTLQVVAALGKPCGVTILGTPPTRIPTAAAPAPAPAPARTTTTTTSTAKKPDPCFIEFGTANAVVAEMQADLNRLLDQNGYKPIPVSGKWDAASCGALYVLGGQFDPVIAACRGGYWSVPASCPQKILPTKKEAKPKLSANMLGFGLLAAASAVGLVIAKKRGLIG